MNRKANRKQSKSQHHQAAALAEQLFAAGRLQEAEVAYRQALKADPANAILCNNFANLLTSSARLDEAIPLYRRALTEDPNFAEAHANLGAALMTQGSYAASVESFNKAISLRPDFYGFQQVLGLCYLRQGLADLAVEHLGKALALNPHDAETHSALLLASCYGKDQTRTSLAAVHTTWNAQHGTNTPRADISPIDRSADRPLRIGYVSADFRRHPVAFFLAPVLAHRDHDRFKVFLYANQHSVDDFSERLNAMCDGWRTIIRADDDAVCRQIQQDGIDILVDLSGHTGHNRLPLFARHPAPIQVTWLGYPGSTGLSAIDYRISDAIADPPGLAANLSSEKVFHLPDGFHCYRPPESVAEPGPLAAQAAGHVTFGSFNTLAKVSATSVKLWSQVLDRVPGSRMIIKTEALANPEVRARVLADFSRHGINSDRLDLLGWTGTLTEHFLTYNRVDVALDTFPYGGTTTTIEALWMGVPVVTLRGETHMARVGASLLTHAGCPQWIADSESAYIDIAAGLTENLAELAALRSTLRSRLQSSPLMDEAGFCRRIEAAYKTMWIDAGKAAP